MGSAAMAGPLHFYSFLLIVKNVGFGQLYYMDSMF